MIWSFYLCHSCDKQNRLNFEMHGYKTLPKLSGLSADIDVSNYHPWGCSAYMLKEKMQSGVSKKPKWDSLARLDIYLG